jgi:hypothetical protein
MQSTAGRTLRRCRGVAAVSAAAGWYSTIGHPRTAAETTSGADRISVQPPSSHSEKDRLYGFFCLLLAAAAAAAGPWLKRPERVRARPFSSSDRPYASKNHGSCVRSCLTSVCHTAPAYASRTVATRRGATASTVYFEKVPSSAPASDT